MIFFCTIRTVSHSIPTVGAAAFFRPNTTPSVCCTVRSSTSRGVKIYATHPRPPKWGWMERTKKLYERRIVDPGQQQKPRASSRALAGVKKLYLHINIKSEKCTLWALARPLHPLITIAPWSGGKLITGLQIFDIIKLMSTKSMLIYLFTQLILENVVKMQLSKYAYM